VVRESEAPGRSLATNARIAGDTVEESAAGIELGGAGGIVSNNEVAWNIVRGLEENGIWLTLGTNRNRVLHNEISDATGRHHNMIVGGSWGADDADGAVATYDRPSRPCWQRHRVRKERGGSVGGFTGRPSTAQWLGQATHAGCTPDALPVKSRPWVITTRAFTTRFMTPA
jgi:hypothetical protein